MPDDSARPSWFVIIPPPVWALAFVFTSIAIGHLLQLETPLRHQASGLALFALGFLTAASGRLAFAKVGAEIRPASKKNSTLVINGPFRYSRNPMYLGLVIAMAGIALVIGTWMSFASAVLFFCFVNWISIPYEEAKMERQFGEAFAAYKRSVRRWV